MVSDILSFANSKTETTTDNQFRPLHVFISNENAKCSFMNISAVHVLNLHTSTACENVTTLTTDCTYRKGV